MRRTQDLAAARLRLISSRWMPRGGQVDACQPLAGDRDRLDSATSGAGRRPETPDAEVPDAEAVLTDGHRADGVAEAGSLTMHGSHERTSFASWVGLLALLAVVVVASGAVLAVRAWPRSAVLPGPGGNPRVPTLATPPLPAPPPSAMSLSTMAVPTMPAATVPVAPVPAAGNPPLGSSPPTSPSASGGAPLIVHVTGDVRRPGIVSVPQGSRVADAVAAAGGLSRGGEVGSVNLARPVVDGERIDVGPGSPAAVSPGPPGGAGSAGAGSAGAGGAGPVDLNTATAADLDALPGVGPVTAGKILEWRAAHGRFTLVDELAEVPGIGPKTLEELRPHVRV